MNEKKRRQDLQREISLILQMREELRAKQRLDPSTETEMELINLRAPLKGVQKQLGEFESKLLIDEARRRGISIPKEPDWWSTDRGDYEGHGWQEQFVVDMSTCWLSETGRAMVTRLIKDDRKKNIEWWVKMVAPLLAALISLMGLVVALVTVARR
jgi:hypothetical protein